MTLFYDLRTKYPHPLTAREGVSPGGQVPKSSGVLCGTWVTASCRDHLVEAGAGAAQVWFSHQPAN